MTLSLNDCSLKILIIIDSLKFGGAEKQAVTDANLLSENGYSVTFLYATGGPLVDSLNGDIRKHKIKTSNQLFAPFCILSFLILNKFDLIHCHMFWAEKVSAIPAFLTRHPLLFNEHGLGKWKKWYHSAIMHTISMFANRVACSCDLNYEIKISKKEVAKRKLLTLYNSFDCTIDSNLVENKKKNKTIGFVGRFHEVKQLDHLIKLAELLINASIVDFKIILVGDGEIRKELENQINKKTLSGYFTFAGFQSDTASFYKEISIFILPSRIEALSVALIEAQAYGIPSIAYDVGGNKEIIINDNTGFLIDVNDTRKLFEKVKILLENEHIWRELSINAYHNSHNKFSNQKRLMNLTAIYNQIKR